MKATRIPGRGQLYGRCGPPFPGSHEKSGPRCDRCKKKMKETGENTYCGTVVLMATFEEA